MDWYSTAARGEHFIDPTLTADEKAGTLSRRAFLARSAAKVIRQAFWRERIDVAGVPRMKFRSKVIPSGNATGVEIPDNVVQALGTQGRPPVTITINGHTWRSRVAAMRGQRLIGISAANRAAAEISEGDVIEIDVEIDEAPRKVVEPTDLAEAFNKSPQARIFFDRLPFGLRQKHVRAIQEAKTAEVRERRVRKLIDTLKDGRSR